MNKFKLNFHDIAAIITAFAFATVVLYVSINVYLGNYYI